MSGLVIIGVWTFECDHKDKRSQINNVIQFLLKFVQFLCETVILPEQNLTQIRPGI